MADPAQYLRGPSPWPSTSTTPASRCKDYGRFIDSCYRFDPLAAAYYHQLKTYISKRQAAQDILTSELQVYKVTRPNCDADIKRSLLNSLTEVVLDLDGTEADFFVLKGHPCPEAISFLGSTLRVRPELFIGHLDQASGDSERKKFYELPALPSRRCAVMHIRMITLGTSLGSQMKGFNLTEARADARKSCQSHTGDLIQNAYYGSTRFRAVDLHNCKVYTVEQLISFSVVHDELRWTGECASYPSRSRDHISWTDHFVTRHFSHRPGHGQRYTAQKPLRYTLDQVYESRKNAKCHSCHSLCFVCRKRRRHVTISTRLRKLTCTLSIPSN